MASLERQKCFIDNIEEMLPMVNALLQSENPKFDLEHLERFQEWASDVQPHGYFNKENEQLWIGTIGAFLGECIIRNLGGKWVENYNPGYDGRGFWQMAVHHKQAILFPFAKVKKFIRDGDEESFLAMYILTRDMGHLIV